MTSLDSISIIINPEKRYYEDILNQIVITEDWNKTGDEYGIRKRGHDIHEFYVAIDNKTDHAVGCISLTMDKSISGDPTDDLWYIGDFFIRPEYRSIGLGKKLFNMVIEKTQGGNIVLHAVSEMLDFYDKKYGFIHSTEYFHPQARLDTEKLLLKDNINYKDYSIVDISEVTWDKVEEYDRKLSGRARGRYLKEWLTYQDSITKVALDTSGSVDGLACVRPQIKNRLSIGPFYADSFEIAEILLHKLLSLPGLKSYSQVWVRIPEINENALRLLESIHDGPFFLKKGTKMMFTKKIVTANPQKIFSFF